MNEPNFNIESICEELSMSRTNLHHKIKALTGQTSSEFLRTFRIKRAGQLLQKGMTISETMYAIGINSRPYFIKSFKEIFEVLPSEYAKK
jgi:AraC-like DNA-binding protein